jgi:ribosomal-protein-alanine N-acetyltransferase
MQNILKIDRSQAIETAWQVTRSDWRFALPLLAGARVTLREITTADAAPLLTMLGREEMAQFVTPGAPTVEGVEAFATRAQRERQSGRLACFAVIPSGCSQAVGLIHLRHLDASTGCAEWHFAVSSQFWGTGVFQDAARLVVEFAFGIGVHRLEARAAVQNGRGNGALHKLGAAQEGVLRKSLFYRGDYVDQILWALVDEDWRGYREIDMSRTPHIH